MKLYFNHEMGFGKMQDETVLHFPFGATFELNERNYALENGWFPINNFMWYQSRSTRINLSKYCPSKKILKLSKIIKYYPHIQMTMDRRNKIEEIYKKYLDYKGFADKSLTVDDMISNSHGHIYYVFDNKIIGFSFYKIIGQNYLSIEFGWDYENPKLSLGNVSLYFEYLFAKTNRCKYIYLGAGYEKCSIYKSHFFGFEWWKGYEWSSDVKKFRKLCERDSSVKISNFEDNELS